MQLISVNVGQSQPMPGVKTVGRTGIFKRPVAGPVRVTADGLEGDAICDVESHGGFDQAIYVFGEADYAWWAAQLGMPVEPGTFGENLTISELESAGFNIGDRLHVGAVILEVTSPRIPCVTLATRMGDPGFVKRFRHAERPGLYCRVIQAGFIQAGDPVSVERYSGPTISAIDMFRDFYSSDRSEANLLRHLVAPICSRDRVDIEAALRKMLAGSDAPTDAVGVVRRFWALMATNDFYSTGAVLGDDFVLEWPQSNERIRGRENFARMNQEYPAQGPWRFSVNRIVGGAGEAVSDVSVTDSRLRGQVITFSTVVAGKITRQVEFWPDPFPAPDNRAHLVERMC